MAAAAGLFFVFQPRNLRWRCVLSPNALYGGKGASHDAVEQDLYDQDITADHFCAGGHSYSEGDKFALRLQLGDCVGCRLVSETKRWPVGPARADRGRRRWVRLLPAGSQFQYIPRW